MAKVDLFALGLKPNYSFEFLVVGAHNQLAAGACQAVAKTPGEVYNPLFIYGPPGVGKTHLVQAVALEILKNNPKAKVKYVTAERMMSDIISAIGEDNVMPVREHYSSVELLVVDDIQYLMQSQTTQEELLHVLNMMQQQNHQLILASDRPPNALVGLNTTLRSRLEGGLAVDVKVPDVSTRVEILRKKQSVQGIQLSDELLVFVAQNLQSNVRELEGFLKRMHAYMTLSHQEITPALVQTVMREVMPASGPQPLHYENPPPTLQPPPAPPPPYQPPAQPAPAPAANQSAADTLVPPAPLSPREQAASPPSPLIEQNPGITNGASSTPPGAEDIPKIERDDYWSPPPPPPQEKAVEPELVSAEVPLPPEPPSSAAPEMTSPEQEVPEFGAEQETDNGYKEIGAVFFYPDGAKEALETVHKKFQEVIKKHKLKFRLRRAESEGYACNPKLDCKTFVDTCKKNKVPVAIVVGPPPGAQLSEQDFHDMLSVTLDVQGVSLQMISWAEITKDYRYLNLALDIALVRSR